MCKELFILYFSTSTYSIHATKEIWWSRRVYYYTYEITAVQIWRKLSQLSLHIKDEKKRFLRTFLRVSRVIYANCNREHFAEAGAVTKLRSGPFAAKHLLH